MGWGLGAGLKTCMEAITETECCCVVCKALPPEITGISWLYLWISESRGLASHSKRAEEKWVNRPLFGLVYMWLLGRDSH